LPGLYLAQGADALQPIHLLLSVRHKVLALSPRILAGMRSTRRPAKSTKSSGSSTLAIWL
jgi:hypothetical protein